MRQAGSTLLVLFLAGVSSGCDGFTLFVSAGPLPDSRTSPTAPLPPRPIVLGDVVHDTFIVPEICFDVQAPRSGTLFIRITWDRRHGDLDLAFLSTVMSTTSHDALVVGTLHVAQGQRYRITVVGEHGPVPFTLTTSLD
ncbi:MAG: hypothetical protein ACRD3G_24620 [Vicinamibacterales bacterium]